MAMLKQLAQTLLICSMVFSAVYFISDQSLGNSDWLFHYTQTHEPTRCPYPYTQETCDTYPPLSHTLSKPFASNPETFKLFVIGLGTFVLPLLVFWITKKANTILLYFSSYFLFIPVYNGALAQTFVMALFLLFLKLRHPIPRLALILAATFTHNLGAPLLLLVWICEYAGKFMKRHPHLLIFAIPRFHTSVENIIVFGKVLFFQTNPIPTIFGLKAILDKKNYAHLLLVIVSFMFGLQSLRAMWVGQLLLVLAMKRQPFSKFKILYTISWIGVLMWLFYLKWGID